MSLSHAQASALVESDTWFRYHLPYAFQRLQEFQGHVWLPLNRDYKPIGQLDKKIVKYSDFVANSVRFSRDPTTFEGVWYGDTGGNTLHLFDDTPKSRVDYFARLERLFGYKLKLTPEGKEATGELFAE